MDAMAGLMIIAHAPLASSLKTVAEHAYPEFEGLIEALDVSPQMSVEELEGLARAMLERVRDPYALVFTDVFGATPCNVAQRLADGNQVKVIAGVNVPMLWRSLCYAREPLDAVVGRAMIGATQGVLQVASAKPQNQTLNLGGHDQDPHYHQQ
jgi:mannose PTS system EIIA component